VDVVVNALHGEYGEDGELQKVLRMQGVAHSGPRELGAAFAFNKQLAKDLLSRNGVKTPYFSTLRREDVPDLTHASSYIYRTFPNPVVVKPSSRGSSIGVSVAETPKEIAAALAAAFEFGDSVLLEEYIDGFEIVCGVVEGYRNEPLYSLFPVEAIRSDTARFLTRADRESGRISYRESPSLGGSIRAALMSTAQHIHRVLNLRHYSTSDFIVHPRRGIYFLEADSLPSLVRNSAFGTALAGVGGTFPDFLEHVVELAIAQR
jgi:D-alanine--D-alanine ligase